MNSTITVKNSAPQKNSGVRIGAGCLMLVGLPFLIISIAGFVDNNGNDFAAFVMVFLFAILLCGGAVLWWRSATKREKMVAQQYYEKQVLNIAAIHDGVLTVVQVCQMTPLSISEAEEALHRLCEQRVAIIDYLDDGTVIYRFTGLSPLLG